MIEIDDVMSRLAARRSVFCSEADFQHELAYDVRRDRPSLGVRLEYPLGTASRGAIDILLIGTHRFALELKYLCKGLTAQVADEAVVLRHQGAHDIRRYDVCKDVERMERYAERTGHGAAVLVLSNDPAYWQPRRGRALSMRRLIWPMLASLAGRFNGTRGLVPGPRRAAKRRLRFVEATLLLGATFRTSVALGAVSAISGCRLQRQDDLGASRHCAADRLTKFDAEQA